jgi:hypothetical protein
VNSASTTVPLGAIAVTGNLTVTDATAGWAFYLGPTAMASPKTSSINFLAGQTKANNVTVALASDGTLSATYISTTGQTADLVFDVTGYFLSGHADSYTTAVPQVYVPESPVRAIDTRLSAAIVAPKPGTPTKLVANQPVCYSLSSYTATGATAVTGIATVTGSTAGWAIALGPTLASVTNPTTSTINFTAGQVVSNGVTVAVGATQNLCIDYIATAPNTADFVFDVTGSFVPYVAQTAGFYMPIAPVRMVDSRFAIGLPGALPANTPWSFQVTSATTGAPVPSNMTAITGNVTVTDMTAGWAVYLGPAPLVTPPSSSINFTAGMVTSIGQDVQLSASGILSATYISTTGNTTSLILDVTGYFN